MSQYRRTIGFFLVTALAVGTLLSPVQSTAGVSEAVNYLGSQSQDAWITQALVAAGEELVPTSHLTSVSGTLATDYAKAILALAAAGEDPATFGNTNYIGQLKALYDGTQMGDSTLINDDMWAILAFASVGLENTPEAQGAKSFILNHQNSDGGWAWAVGAESDTNDTAAAIMALLEVGLTPASTEIVNAVSYLESTQNADGGIPYQAGFDSDSGSGAWTVAALNKLGIDATTWNTSGNTPISHMNSLQDTDGGYWWVTPDTSEFNNKAMTPFVVIALSGKSIPVGVYAPGGNGDEDDDDDIPPSGMFDLRIEGQNATVCDAQVSGTTALDVVVNAAQTCGYTYVIQDTSFGPYLSQINDDEAVGLRGWLYFVDAVSPPVGAADYSLEPDDQVLWYYGDFGDSPTRIGIEDTSVDSDAAINLRAEYFNGTDWLILPDATVKGGDQDFSTNDGGNAIILLPDGMYELYVERDGFVRSNRIEVQVGEGVGRGIGLQVEVNQGTGGGGGVGGDAIIFSVTPEAINFGTLQPGQTQVRNVMLGNEGTGNLIVHSNVTGDPLFTDNTLINEEGWEDFVEILSPDQSKDTAVSLQIPAGYLGSGVKTGEIIFWAQSE